MKNNLIKIIAIAVVVGLLGFYAGMQYQKSQRGNFLVGSRNGATGQQGTIGKQGNNIGGPVNGEITSFDATTITVKTKDGNSKVIVYSDSTKVNKTSEGSKSDLKVGEEVMIIGTTSSDGTVTAQTISLGSGSLNMPAGGQPGQQNGQQPPTETQK